MNSQPGIDGFGRIMKIMRRVAVDSQPGGIMLGEYLGGDKFKIGDHTFKKGEYLISEHLTKYERKMYISLDDKSENKSGGSGYAEFASHNHEIKLKETDAEAEYDSILKKGDAVICYQFGDEDYVIIDKVVSDVSI